MRRIKISQLVAIFVLAFNIHASPLLFKTTKQIKTDTSEEIATFDATKYKNLRIAVHILGRDPMNCVNMRSKEMLRSELERLREGLKAEDQRVTGAKFPPDFWDRQRKQIAEKEEAYKNAKDFPCANISIMVVEDGDEFRLEQSLPVGMANGVAFYNIPTPPQKLKVIGHGEAVYKLYIWGD